MERREFGGVRAILSGVKHPLGVYKHTSRTEILTISERI
jgi:hypothetical protein